MTRLFVSHATANRQAVESVIVSLLRHNGFDAWYAPDDIKTGSEWESTIRSALESCGWFLVVLTPEAVKSPWVKAEVDWAFEHRVGRILPVILAPCNWKDLHLLLRTVQLVDFTGDLSAARGKLLCVLGSSFYRSTSAVRSVEQQLSPEEVDERNENWDQFQAHVRSLSPADRLELQKYNTLRRLSRYGLELHELKAQLIRFGYLRSDSEGFPDEIVAAIELFQRRNNLRHVDGIFGEMTYLAMEAFAKSKGLL